MGRKERMPWGLVGILARSPPGRQESPRRLPMPRTWHAGLAGARQVEDEVRGYFVRTTWVAWSVAACSVHL